MVKIDTARYKDLKFYTRRNYVEDIVIVDGITRAGKFMLAHVVAALDGIDFIQYPLHLETLPYLVRLGKLDLETCRILLQTDVDSMTYDRMIGRNLNTRRSDITSIYNSVDHESLLRRAVREDEPAMVREFLEAKRLPMFFCHEGMCNMSVLLDAFPKARVVHILRDPAAIALSWHKKGYGKRWGTDPKMMAYAFDTPHGIVPWFAVDIAQDYAEATEMERVVLCIANIMRMAREEYASLTPAQKKQILFLSFESFVADVETSLALLERFTGKTRHARIGDILKRERLPRPFSDKAADEAAAAVGAQIGGRAAEAFGASRREHREYWVGSVLRDQPGLR